MDEWTWRATLYPTPDDGMRVDRLHSVGETPGNVGVCFSGGGSRAMAAAAGQLRGLAHVQVDGRPALDHVRAIAAVSGGSWCLAPFTWLTPGVSDEDFLGPWAAPEALRLSPPRPPFAPPSAGPAGIDDLHPHFIGQVAADDAFSLPRLALEALALNRRAGVAPEDLWQTLMARHILRRYDLYRPGAREQPTTTFASSVEARAALLAANPSLRPEAVHVPASGVGRLRRPFLIRGAGVFVDEGEAFEPLAPLHMTGLFTGVVGAPVGLDVNGRAIGGGGVASFAHASTLAEAPVDGEARVNAARPWSLLDAIGTSSVSYAEAVQNFYNQLAEDPARVHAQIAEKLPPGVSAPEAAPPPLVETARRITDINPRYPRWSLRAPVAGAGGRTRYADGGSLDNTAITWMLAYGDVDHIIAFVNSMTPMAQTDRGVLDAAGAEIPDSRILIYEQVPPLFGYQPWKAGVGYRLYAGDPDPGKPIFAHNQVFEASAFAPLLRALRAASQAGAAWYTAPTVATVTLRVLENRWFGIRGRGGPDDANPRPVRLTLSYLARVRRWRDRLQPPLRAWLGDVDAPRSCGGFPNLSTMDTAMGGADGEPARPPRRVVCRWPRERGNLRGRLRGSIAAWRRLI